MFGHYSFFICIDNHLKSGDGRVVMEPGELERVGQRRSGAQVQVPEW